MIPPADPIRLWPDEDRPREKLLENGPGSLSNAELLAILMRTGTRGQSALDLSRKILSKFKTFRALSQSESADWFEFSGVGPAKLAQIRAALEIGRRFREDEIRENNAPVVSAAMMAEVLMPAMRDLKIEIFKAVYLDGKNRIIKIADITEGTVNRASPFIREIFQKALSYFAVSVVCAHNHPSGDITPSPEDKRFTSDLFAAGQVLGIKLIDHIIIGDNKYFSFADRGEIN